MANHRRNTPTLKSLSKRQWMKFSAVVAGIALVATAGVVSTRFFYQDQHQPTEITSFSATSPSAASRGAARQGLRGADGNTSYVTVNINGDKTTVLGNDFTDVKSVLEAGGIVLGPDDTVDPSLDTKVTESTVITINRAGADVETTETAIPFNEVRKETSALPRGTEKVEQEGAEGVMESTNLVTRAGSRIVSSNALTSYVKQAPVDKVILVGTGSVASHAGSAAGAGSAGSANLGTTVPASEMQQWAHDYLLSSGYTEADFSAAVYIINHESGWNPTAKNPGSGAYGLPQALPGSKMASAGADWATNYQTQFKWFVGYCNGRYGSIQGAYSYWLKNHSY